ncbi:hypothetical protein AB4Z10_14500 [Bosea sp. RAF48]|uniref:hypothetical protein n=1 Tax=Bosea sp. RAF48 TaxID=3237480 RepID=UPI003F8FDFA7
MCLIVIMFYSSRSIGGAGNEPAKRDFDPRTGAQRPGVALPRSVGEATKERKNRPKGRKPHNSTQFYLLN